MIDAEHAISHHKVMMITDEFVIMGNFNFTKAAQEETAEPVLSIRGPALAAQSMPNGDAHRRHRQPSVGQGVCDHGGAGVESAGSGSPPRRSRTGH
jgi:phosphatidylserine/phosphatidylglycerophosphate/cardiolipin synthase-like enzyme